LENGLVNLVNRFGPGGVLTRILCIRRFGDMAERLGPEIPVDCLGYERGFHPRGVLRLARYLAKHRVQVLHTRNQASLIWGGLARFLNPRVRHVHSEHGTPVDPHWMARLLVRRAHTLLSVAPNLADEMRQFYRLPPEREIEVILNGVDTDRFRPLAAGELPNCDLRDLLRCPAETFLFATIGRLDANKNQELAMRALRARSIRALSQPGRHRKSFPLAVVSRGSNTLSSVGPSCRSTAVARPPPAFPAATSVRTPRET
jgi:glycosyltransferase involved in cell wall biosynthesis